jgi:hypothetical protein
MTGRQPAAGPPTPRPVAAFPILAPSYPLTDGTHRRAIATHPIRAPVSAAGRTGMGGSWMRSGVGVSMRRGITGSATAGPALAAQERAGGPAGHLAV